MRRAPNPAITARMYRHFAVVTVLLTIMVSVFANGERQQAQAAEASAKSQTEQRAKPDKPIPTPSPDAAAGDSGTWGSDDGDFGSPGDWAQDSLGGSASLAHPFDGDDGDVASDQSGGSDDDGGQPTAAQIAAITAASRLRSGSPDSD